MTESTKPEPNVELFLDVLAHIERHPETHDQDWWGQRTECGTTYCFAGHALVLSGKTLLWSARTEPRSEIKLSDGFVPDMARTLLGVGFSDASTLFYDCSTLVDLYRASAEILGIDETVLRDKVAAAVSA